VVGPDGSIWVADTGDAKIRRILPNGTQSVVNSGIAATQIALDSAGNLYATDAAAIWRSPSGGALCRRRLRADSPGRRSRYDCHVSELIQHSGFGDVSRFPRHRFRLTRPYPLSRPSNGLIATQLAGVRVLFQGVPAPVLYASDGRAN